MLAAAGAALAPLGACTGGGNADDGPASTSGAGSTGTATAGTSTGTVVPPPPVDPGDPVTWRAQFSLSSDIAHFAAFTLAAHPRRVAEAIDRHRLGLDEAVADLDGVHVATPMSPELSSGIVCIEIDGVQPFGVLAGLLERGFSTGITPYRNNYLRIGPSVVTTPDETEALVEAIADLA